MQTLSTEIEDLKTRRRIRREAKERLMSTISAVQTEVKERRLTEEELARLQASQVWFTETVAPVA